LGLGRYLNIPPAVRCLGQRDRCPATDDFVGVRPIADDFEFRDCYNGVVARWNSVFDGDGLMSANVLE
jgi:hypothetical protein